jgi:MoaA/NifB/PqqE/SkfB family radical SAM enzyme
MFKFSDLRQLHLEISNNCQASCPMCTRNIHGGIENPLIKTESWTLDRYKSIINKEVLTQISAIYFCGNYGDPLLNNHLLEMVDYTRQMNSEIELRIHTNGSLRSKSWWAKLAIALPKNHKVIFAIDGLEDTQAIYRIGTDYEKIIENARAFILAGGRAEWAFIRFKHNEHQVSEAKNRAYELGFEDFTMKDSSRFLLDAKFPVYNKNKETIYYLEPSQYSEIKFIDKKVIDQYKDIVKRTEIKCYAVKMKEVYINAQGHVFPCCWLSMIPYQAPDELSELRAVRNEMFHQYEQLVESLGGIDNLNVDKKSLKDIIDSTEYQSVWDYYWNENKLITCVRTCGVQPELFSTPQDQFISKTELKAQ